MFQKVDQIATEHRKWLIPLIALLMGLCTFLVYKTGGTKFVYLHAMYIPILLAAWKFGPLGGAISGIIAGLLLGPLMPLEVETGEIQKIGAWVYRTAFFGGIGAFFGGLCAGIHQRLDQINRLAQKVTTNYVRTLKSFSTCVALRDEQTGGHCERVALNACEVGRRLGLSEEHDIPHLYFAGLLHDLGKIGVPDRVLLDSGKLTTQQFDIIKRHCAFGSEILSEISNDFSRIAEGVKSHHERWDGKGYPDGRKEAEIPFFARVLAVVDVFEALTSNRPYRKPMDPEEAISVLEENAGSHFDPEIVDVFVELFRRNEIFSESDSLPDFEERTKDLVFEIQRPL